MRFGEESDQKRNLIKYGPRKTKTAKISESHENQVPDYERLMDLLSDHEAPATVPPGAIGR